MLMLAEEEGKENNSRCIEQQFMGCHRVGLDKDILATLYYLLL